MSQTHGGSQSPARRDLRGSALSDRQVTEASRRGRLVTFRFLKSQPAHETIGYVVGKDDYHWMVACPPDTGASGDHVSIQLVHKSTDLILLDTVETLSSQTAEIQATITNMGEPFWASQRSQQP